jgi:hypothetical protein
LFTNKFRSYLNLEIEADIYRARILKEGHYLNWAVARERPSG